MDFFWTILIHWKLALTGVTQNSRTPRDLYTHDIHTISDNIDDVIRNQKIAFKASKKEKKEH